MGNDKNQMKINKDKEIFCGGCNLTLKQSVRSASVFSKENKYFRL